MEVPGALLNQGLGLAKAIPKISCQPTHQHAY